MAGLLAVHQNVSYTATAGTNSTALSIGQTYVIVSTSACWVKHGATGQAAVTSATGYLLPAGAVYEVPVRNAGEQFISVVRVADDGVLSISRSN